MIVYSEEYLKHDREYHPENKNRLRSIMNLLTREDVFERVPLATPKRAEEEDILKVHTEEHLELIKSTSRTGGLIDIDTYLSQGSFEIAMLAAGGVMSCVDLYREGHNCNFAIVRPPGHHADSNRARGFCLFNNVATGAKYAMDAYQFERIFILDYDVHHGNGTEKIFYSDDNVLFFSLHQHPLYPGTGAIGDIGEGNGVGYNINIPLPPGTSDYSYLRAINEIAMPVLKEFKPELIFVSAGYDGHQRDPLGGMVLSANCYYEISKALNQSDAGVIFSLEGGYNLEALAESVHATLAPFFDLEVSPEEPKIEDATVTRYTDSKLIAAKKMLSEYWNV
jgi:acetoin utilization deacetylase AcuC-like enzyme